VIFQELIKVRGFQVAPAELEGILLEHPDIIDAAVIGVPKRTEGTELPRAYLVTRPYSEVTEKDVIRHMQERLAKYKQLDGGVVFVDAIPKNASGKILKKLLREQLRKELAPKL
jgi:4-coumarate--CoA ligase